MFRVSLQKWKIFSRSKAQGEEFRARLSIVYVDISFLLSKNKSGGCQGTMKIEKCCGKLFKVREVDAEFILSPERIIKQI
jgi:hypothetical protein